LWTWVGISSYIQQDITDEQTRLASFSSDSIGLESSQSNIFKQKLGVAYAYDTNESWACTLKIAVDRNSELLEKQHCR